MTERRVSGSTRWRVVAELCVTVFGLAGIIASGGGGGGGNAEPVADAGNALTVNAQTIVTLNGGASTDPDGSITGFEWVQISGPIIALNNSTTVFPSFRTPSLVSNNNFIFQLTVTDDAGATDSATVTITVRGVGAGSFTLSGIISAPTVVAVDSDTNDPNTQFTSNDTPNAAQTISNPITLGGYVNAPGSGESGRSQLSGDLDDYFRVRLLGGQTVTMLVSDFQTGFNDIDLYLHDSTGQFIVDSSLGAGEIERVVVPADGEYLVNPRIFRGASNYVLIIGTTGIADTRGALRLSSNFVPGQAVVRYETSAGLSRAQSFDSMAATNGFNIRAGAPDRPMLLELDKPASSQATLKSADTHGSRTVFFNNPEDHAKWETLMAIKALQKDPAVKYAEPNFILKATAIPNDEFYDTQWHYPLIQLPAAWDLTTGNPGVIVAVIDTGVLLNHPDLQGQLVAGYDFIDSIFISGDGNGIDPNPDDPGDGGVQPSSFHGTHVSGTVAAASNNGIGVAGVAWEAKIMPLRVLGIGGGTSYDIGQAVRFAAGLPNDSNTVPAQRADVMNLSLGGGGFSQASQDTFTAARNAGVIIVAAAGNESSSQFSYPASYDGVISVSAVDAVRQLTTYSNFGTAIDVAAPGGDFRADRNADGYPDSVASTGGEDTSGFISFIYRFSDGTSMASPHIAGVMALMKSVNADLTPMIIDQQLALGTLTDDLGAAGRDNSYGHGLINAQKAVTTALSLDGSPPPDIPVLGVTPILLHFDAATSSIEITLQNTGKGNLQLNSITPSESWLTVTPDTDVDSNGLGTYVVSVNRSGLPDGIYSGQITAQSSANTVNISVVMTVGIPAGGGDVGFIYLLLIDADTGRTVDVLTPQASGGLYEFSFSGIAAGAYQLVAGTDSDNDFIICDPGESCGIYLTIDQPIRLNVSGNQANLNFPIGYVVTLPTTTMTSDDSDKSAEISRGRPLPTKVIAR